MTTDGKDTSTAEMAAVRDLGMNVTLALNEDGTAQLILFEEPLNGSWQAGSGNTVTITLEGEPITGEVSNGLLVLRDGGDVLSFHRMEG